MELLCYQAECGDAIRIRYIGNDGKPHNIFLDSGYERTYRNILEKEINTLIQQEEIIDLWIISHIHDDHIGGAIKYIKSINDGEIKDIVDKWLYNPPRYYIVMANDNNVSLAKSIRQGDMLYDYLFQKNKLPNFDIVSDMKNSQYIELFGLKITLLSPTLQTLEELRNKYKDGKSLEQSEDDSICQAKSAYNSDYHIPLDDFNISIFDEDDSLENKSSISALFEYEDRKILWLADSCPSVIFKSLMNLGYSVQSPLQCDFVVVSHHASKGNNSSQLFNVVKCNNYIISSNGENKHYLPDKETISRIIRNEYRSKKSSCNLYFTYGTQNLKDIFRSDGNKIFEKWNFISVYSNKPYLHFEL
jgi:beta-lactamase superfamily II metal-dependent hydrolase